MFENFNLEISKIFKESELIRYDLRHSYVGSEHLLLSILKNDNNISKIFKDNNVTFNKLKKELTRMIDSNSTVSKVSMYTPMLKKIIENAINNANENNNGIVTSTDLVLSMLEISEGIAVRILLLMNVDLEKIYNELKMLNVNNNILNINNSINLNEEVKNTSSITGRDKEINNLIEVLLRCKKNNPILVGQSGVGKTAIVCELARKINEKNVPDELVDCKIISLELGSLLAGTKYRGEFEEKITNIINNVKNNKNIILFIDEIHCLVNAGNSDGAISASDIFKPYLSTGKIKIIGATTEYEYNKYFLKDKALVRRFEKIIVKEPNVKDTIDMIMKIKGEYETYHSIKISYKNIKDIVYLSDKYICNKCNPDKSVELLDMVCSMKKCNSNYTNQKNRLNNIIKEKNMYIKNNNYAKALLCKLEENKIRNNKNTKLINKKDILKVIEDKTGIPLISNISYENELSNILDKKNIDSINNMFNESIINSILLFGSNSDNKEKVINIFKKRYHYIHIDLNTITSVNSLIGIPYGYDGCDSSYLFEEIKNYPYSLVVFDNIDKANKKIIDLLKNIFNNKRIKDNHNEYIDFSNCLFIFKFNKNLNTFGFNNKISFNSFIDKELLNNINVIINDVNINCKQYK